MIFYLVPPPVIIDLVNFNECCTSRFKLFANNMDYNDVGILEATIPGTKMDKVGHFVLRFFLIRNLLVRKVRATSVQILPFQMFLLESDRSYQLHPSKRNRAFLISL